MRNLNLSPIHQDLPIDNLSMEAKKVLEILDELENFTLGLRKKLMVELKVEGKNNE